MQSVEYPELTFPHDEIVRSSLIAIFSRLSDQEEKYLQSEKAKRPNISELELLSDPLVRANTFYLLLFGRFIENGRISVRDVDDILENYFSLMNENENPAEVVQEISSAYECMITTVNQPVEELMQWARVVISSRYIQ